MKAVRLLVPALLLLLPGLLAAQQPLEKPFRVNIQPDRRQSSPDVATNRSGEYVVVWGSHDAPASFKGRLYARRFGAAGQPLTGEILVADNVSPFGEYYQAALQDDGSFAVAFAQFVNTPAGEAAALKLRWLTPEGVVEGEATVAEGAGVVSMAATADGGVVLSWGGTFGVGAPVYARVYGPDRAPLSPAVLVDATGNQADVAAAPDGSFVVAWQNSNQAANFTEAKARVSFRRFAADGSPLSPGVDVTGDVSYGGFEGPVWKVFTGVDGDGNILVVWSGYEPALRAPRGRWFTKNVTPQTRAFRIAWGEGSNAMPQSFSLGERGNFVLSWSRFSNGNSQDIYARLYSRNGSGIGAPVKANEGAGPSFLRFGTADILPGGRFVVSWVNVRFDQTLGVMARRFRSR